MNLKGDDRNCSFRFNLIPNINCIQVTGGRSHEYTKYYLVFIDFHTDPFETVLNRFSGVYYMLHKKQVKRFFEDIAGRNIGNRALMRLIFYFESEMKEIIKVCVEEHENLNEMKEFHRLYQKKRIDEEAILRAIEFINKKRDITPKTNREVLQKIGDIR